MAAFVRVLCWGTCRWVVLMVAFAVLAVSVGGLGAAPAVAEGSSGCSLYASNGGSDSQAGTQAAPFRTLSKLVGSLAAGGTGCLQSGETFDGEGNVAIEGWEAHGQEGHPVTITSTNPAEPATVTHSLALYGGVNYMIFTHLDFNWSMPKPWACLNGEGDGVAGEVIVGSGRCGSGQVGPEDAVQLVVDGKDDRFTYDDITSNDTDICLVGGSTGEDDVFEDDRVHDCGPPVESALTGFPVPNEEWGWHTHGIYDFAHGAIIRNDYIYDNARDGVLLYGGGGGAVVEHNVIDHNGAGVWFGDDTDDVVAWNIVTNSTSPREGEDYGIGGAYPGAGNVAKHNCLYGNLGEEGHEIRTKEFGGGPPGEEVKYEDNLEKTNPQYVDAATHEYELQPGSPCQEYGPQTAPIQEPPAEKKPVEHPDGGTTPSSPSGQAPSKGSQDQTTPPDAPPSGLGSGSGGDPGLPGRPTAPAGKPAPGKRAAPGPSHATNRHRRRRDRFARRKPPRSTHLRYHRHRAAQRARTRRRR
ncbi:MAG TPA: right-handed parallel beta-helix repeat-containing protein [Solirubrobacteraceae bacterium]|nr:right-handed parallel beta-helix repeat-containing protein [Solirubrobacteraceae bacterium]